MLPIFRRPARLLRRADDDVAGEYELRWLRYLEHDNLMWTTPALALAAQAFLFTIALGVGSTPFGRTVAAALAVLVSLASIQLMDKHAYFRQLDAVRLEQLDRTFEHADGAVGRPGLASLGWGVTEQPGLPLPKKPWHVNRKSSVIWKLLLWAFLVAAVLVVVVTWCLPGWLQ